MSNDNDPVSQAVNGENADPDLVVPDPDEKTANDDHEASQQDHHNPETEEDTASGGPA
jgi:hypothetical protein